jgi:hypothetical protein
VTDEERFWSYVEKTDGCWWWKPSKERNSHGFFSVSGKSVAAHRYSYLLAHGPISRGMHVLHSCDHPACVRPDHLHEGTQQQNSDEWKERRPDRNRRSPLHPRTGNRTPRKPKGA